jgi:hypothetical protein
MSISTTGFRSPGPCGATQGNEDTWATCNLGRAGPRAMDWMLCSGVERSRDMSVAQSLAFVRLSAFLTRRAREVARPPTQIEAELIPA